MVVHSSPVLGLPIPEEVVESIDDYVNDGRPDTTSEFIFFNSRQAFPKAFRCIIRAKHSAEAIEEESAWIYCKDRTRVSRISQNNGEMASWSLGES